MPGNIPPNQAFHVYIPMDRRLALVQGVDLPAWADGTVLFADISGFTPLTEALTQTLGPRRGVEELTQQLNRVYDALVTEVDQYGGSVIGFSGDAMTCWFADTMPEQAGPVASAAYRATACALALQQRMQPFAAIPLPTTGTVRLALKVTVASGPVLRMLLGDPRIQRLEVLAGATVMRMADAERLAAQGEVLIDQVTFIRLDNTVDVAEWRTPSSVSPSPEKNGDRSFAVITRLRQSVAPTPWPVDTIAALTTAHARPWLLPAVYERLQEGLGEFLTELRPVVALFLRFDGIDYEHDPIAAEQLDIYICRVQQLLTRYDGTFMQLTIGDKGNYLYAAFGTPIAHEDDTRRAVMCAEEIRLTSTLLTFIQTVQIGMSQGIARTGTYGGTTRRTYSALGDDVNLAARLMQLASPGEILVSEQVQRATAAAFDWDMLPPIAIKGKRNLVSIARLVRTRTVATPGITYTGTLIGRSAELSCATAWAQPLWDGHCAGILFISGEAGMGKSRLVDELRRQLSAARSVRWFTCPADNLQHQSLYPFRAWLLGYFQQQADQPEAVNKACFDHMLDTLIASSPPFAGEDGAAVLPARNADDGTDSLPVPIRQHASTTTRYVTELQRTRSFLGALIGLHWSGSLYEQLDPRLRFENTLAALKTLILAESQRQPLLLHFEDAHLLDPDTQTFIQLLLRNVTSIPFGLILTSRYDDGGSGITLTLDADVPQQRIDLRPLPAEGTRTLATQILGGQIDEPLAQLFATRTGGNPFFIEQLALDLRERGLLQQPDAHTYPVALPPLSTTHGELAQELATRRVVYHLPTSADIPDSINAVLVARLDRLTAQVRAVVQTASVLGMEFEVRVLSSMLKDEHDLPHKIQQATAAAIWQPLNEVRYLFHNGLLRDAIYAMQVESRLRELHALAGTALEQMYASDLTPYAADLVYHFHKADDPEREQRYARIAGEDAANRFANLDAIRYLSRALELTPMNDHAERYALLRMREQVADRQGLREAQHRDLMALLSLAETLNHVPARIEVALRQAHYAGVTGDYTAMINAAQTAIQLAQVAQDTRAESAGHLQWARALWYQGDYDAAQTHALQALELARVAQDIPLQADSLRVIGNAALYQGQYLAAHTAYEQALTLHRITGDQQAEGSTLNNLGIVAWYQGDYETARSAYAHNLRLKRDIGDRYGESVALLNLGEVAAVQYDYPAAQHYYQQALRLKNETGDRYGASVVLLNLADIAAAQGDYAQAQRTYVQSLEMSRTLGHRQQESTTLAKLALLLHHQGDHLTAASHSQQALDLAQAINDRNTQALAQTHLGHALVGLARLDEAQVAYQQALDLRYALSQSNQALEPLAGLAHIALTRQDLAQASIYVTDILHHLQSGTLEGTEKPFRIYLICYYVLYATNDARAATVLITAYTQLQQRAAHLNPDARQVFFEQVPDHRELLAVVKERGME